VQDPFFPSPSLLLLPSSFLPVPFLHYFPPLTLTHFPGSSVYNMILEGSVDSPSGLG
jgi:hypothetical protein